VAPPRGRCLASYHHGRSESTFGEPYAAPAAVSSTDTQAIQSRAGGDASTATRDMPGVFTRKPSDQPGIEANIRGLSGFGRVNSMIDGVPQTYRNVAGHASSGGSLTYVDPELLAGVDVYRGSAPGAHGSGALAGAVNYRTLGLDDVLLEGNNWGGMTRLKTGTNGKPWAALFAGGGRTEIEGVVTFGIVGAISRSRFDEFVNGAGQTNTAFTNTNAPLSGLAKLYFEPDAEQQWEFGGRWYDNRFKNANYMWNLRNGTYTARYAFNPASDLIDLNVNAFINQTRMTYDPGGTYTGRDANNTGYGINADNTSIFALGGNADLTLFYGGSWHLDDYQINLRRGGNPPGQLGKYSAFADATVNWGMVSLTGGLRYDAWTMNGYQPPINPGWGSCPAGGPACGDKDVSRSDGELNPKVTLSVQPSDWLELYGTYSHTFRPPTVQEMLYSMVPLGAGVGTGAANNLDLLPERSRGWEVGFNITKDNLLFADDSLRLKVGYFDKNIENYVYNEFINVPGRGPTSMWVNHPDPFRMSGFELEGKYDAGFAYASLSYTNSNTAQPQGGGTGVFGLIASLPKHYLTLDVGTRWLDDQALTIGGVVRHVGESSDGTASNLTKPYTLLDAYASYEVNRNASVFLNVENITNEVYTPAGTNQGNYGIPVGRGRTAVIGTTLRF
jgi:hemoglobin/transferrin/lactoferrin receptor protein